VSVLDIRVLGDPILRQDTKPVAVVTDELSTLIDDMFVTMLAAQGIGLAAPQVGRTERIAVVHVTESGVGPLALVNPEIVSREGSVKGEEGCLSIPDIFGDVERASKVVVRALDRTGAAIEIEATDLLARCLQHEIDHLHGKLFIDHLSVLKRRAALDQWAEMKEKYPRAMRRLSDEVPGQHRSEEL
jgi:peptide deformylase